MQVPSPSVPPSMLCGVGSPDEGKEMSVKREGGEGESGEDEEGAIRGKRLRVEGTGAERGEGEEGKIEETLLLMAAEDPVQSTLDGFDHPQWIPPAIRFTSAWTGFLTSTHPAPNKRYRAKCTFCSAEMDGKTTNLRRHMLNRCAVIDAESRRIYRERSMPEPTAIAVAETSNIKRSAADMGQSSKAPFGLRVMGNEEQGLHDRHLCTAFASSDIPFRLLSNKSFREFFDNLPIPYKLPTREELVQRILPTEYEKAMSELGDKMKTISDVTLCMDGWEDASGNSMFAFMALKAGEQHILDVTDLSGLRPNATNLRTALAAAMDQSFLEPWSVIAIVTDSPTIMVRVRTDVSREFPNIVPIRCALHQYNLIMRDIAKHPVANEVVKTNAKLVNYFLSSHFWRRKLQKWQMANGIKHSLQTFCTTRWYSMALLCLGVESFEQGFKSCYDASVDDASCPPMPPAIMSIINNRFHFAYNSEVTKLVTPIINAIGRLESREATLGSVYAELIESVVAIKKTSVAGPVQPLKDHALTVINKGARQFREDHPPDQDIYMLALFLSPRYRRMAVSRFMSVYDMKRIALNLAIKWSFTKSEAQELSRLFDRYSCQEDVFAKPISSYMPRDYWLEISGAYILRRLALKLFGVVPHSAEVERLFSSLSLSKTNNRNRMNPTALKMLAVVRNSSTSESVTGSTRVLVSRNVGNSTDVTFSVGSEEEDEVPQLEEVGDVAPYGEMGNGDGADYFLEELFEFDMYENASPGDNSLRAVEESA